MDWTFQNEKSEYNIWQWQVTMQAMRHELNSTECLVSLPSVATGHPWSLFTSRSLCLCILHSALVGISLFLFCLYLQPKAPKWHHNEHRVMETQYLSSCLNHSFAKQTLAFLYLHSADVLRLSQPFTTLLYKEWSLAQHLEIIWEYVRNAKIPASPPNYWIRVCIFIRSRGDSHEECLRSTLYKILILYVKHIFPICSKFHQNNSKPFPHVSSEILVGPYLGFLAVDNHFLWSEQ